MNLKEIETRKNEIHELLKGEVTLEQMEAFEKEVNELEEQRKSIELAQEKRTALINATLRGEGTIVEENKEERKMEFENVLAVNETPEYRSGWLKNIRKLELNEVEKRALTTAEGSVGAVIPTMTANKIIDKIKQYAPLLSKIDLMQVPGGVTIAVEGVNNDADIHVEGAAITAKADTLVKVSLGAYEIVKLVTISKSVSKMSVEAFEGWLVDKIARKVARKISALIIYGTGSSQPEGIDLAQTWGSTNSITVALAGSLTATNVRDLIGLLPGGYDENAEFLMSKKTFYSDFIGLQDSAKHSLISNEGRQFYISGYPVMFDESVTLHEAYLGDFRAGYVGNMPEEANVVSQFVARENAFDFLGSAMFDGKVALDEAFVKLVKATS